MQMIVLGMHRSGTSITTRLINMMGAYFGPESSVGEITIDNPKGFWERPEVFKLNESILAAQGCSWHDLARWNMNTPPVAHDSQLKTMNKIILGMDAFRPWVLKDPRLCLLLPLWRRFLEVPIIVIVHRDPVEIALSLQKRDGFPLENGLQLWERYAHGIVRHSHDLPRIHIRHEDLLKHPAQTCHNLYQQLVDYGVRRLALPTEKEITAFIDPKLDRSKPTAHTLSLSAEQQVLADRLAGIIPFSQQG